MNTLIVAAPVGLVNSRCDRMGVNRSEGGRATERLFGSANPAQSAAGAGRPVFVIADCVLQIGQYTIPFVCGPSNADDADFRDWRRFREQRKARNPRKKRGTADERSTTLMSRNSEVGVIPLGFSASIGADY
jgi:hypothetical protein